MDVDGDEGVLLAVSTDLTLDIFGFVTLDGSFSFKKATGSFVLTNASTHTSTALDEVVGEGIVVVDHQQHGAAILMFCMAMVPVNQP